MWQICGCVVQGGGTYLCVDQRSVKAADGLPQ